MKKFLMVTVVVLFSYSFVLADKLAPIEHNGVSTHIVYEEPIVIKCVPDDVEKIKVFNYTEHPSSLQESIYKDSSAWDGKFTYLSQGKESVYLFYDGSTKRLVQGNCAATIFLPVKSKEKKEWIFENELVWLSGAAGKVILLQVKPQDSGSKVEILVLPDRKANITGDFLLAVDSRFPIIAVEGTCTIKWTIVGDIPDVEPLH